MKRYRIAAPLTITATTVVYADSEEEAIEKALGRGVQTLCYHCSCSEGVDEEWTVTELDGMPDDRDLEVEVDDE